MTSLLEARRAEIRPPVDRIPVSRWSRLRRLVSRNRINLIYVLPLMTATAAARLVGLAGSPQRFDDEGTYVAQAYAVQKFGELAHYTFWYDHPPLGWLQIAGWTWLTGGFSRYDQAVLAGREAMVVAAVVSAGLLWMLARRLGLSRPAAAGAVLIFALSPLALQFTRSVYLDNIATAWTLAAFVLALSRHRQLLSFAGAAGCFAVAVLSKETYLLLLPFLAWQLWRSAHPSTRRYTLSVAGALFTLMLAGYITFALVKGEVLPGPDRVSLLGGIEFQLVNRAGSGSIFDPGSQAGRSADVWLTLDPVLAVAALLAALAAVFVRRLRPYAAAYLVLTLVLLKPGYLPVPYVIAMIPFGALLIAAVLDAGIRRGRRPGPSGRALAALSGSAALAFAVVAGLVWAPQLNGLWRADLDRPLREAVAWMDANASRDDRLLVDDAVWVDLVEDGFPRDNVVWYYKADTDSDVFQRTPNGWQDYQYVMVTEGMRQAVGTAATLDAAVKNSTRVAVFGSGTNEVDVMRIHQGGTDAFYQADYLDQQGRLAAGRELIDNPTLDLAPVARLDLLSGTVDSRIISLLALLSSEHRIQVADFPSVFGENGQLPSRTVTITTVDGQPTDAEPASKLAGAARDQLARYLPAQVDQSGEAITIRYAVASPDDTLLPQPAP